MRIIHNIFSVRRVSEKKKVKEQVGWEKGRDIRYILAKKYCENFQECLFYNIYVYVFMYKTQVLNFLKIENKKNYHQYALR